jgi:hypothetical protein
MSHVRQIKVAAPIHNEKFGELARVLETVFAIKFGLGDAGESAGEILSESPQSPATNGNVASLCRLVLSGSTGTGADRVTEIRVRFSDDDGVPFPFRGRALSCKVGVRPEPLKLVAGEKALLTCERGVVWAQSEVRGRKVFRSALALPEIPAGGNLQDVLNGDRFLELLPLLHFLRTVTDYYQWQRPPVRAQFMFDDPNLHWPTYGLVKYGELARRAEKENYHVSFATVPLDAWFTHGGAVEIFQRNPGRLSLCVHGNDHTKRELAQNYTLVGRIALLRQAIRRIEKLARRSGLPISKVMVPPHGACSHEMLAEIVGCGFESACISHGSLRAHNRARAWTKALGYLPAETIEGCPVLPRWGFVGTTENTILLAAFLDQALVLRGHHQDLKGGIELLDGFARIINGLGNVTWTNMSEISQQSYASVMEGKTLRLRPWSSKIVLAKSPEATEVIVDDNFTTGTRNWRITVLNGTASSEIRSGDRFSLPNATGKSLLLERVVTATEQGAEVNRVPAAAFVRRLLTEGRDRFQGVFGCR